jgi:hypothetical protein
MLLTSSLATIAAALIAPPTGPGWSPADETCYSPFERQSCCAGMNIQNPACTQCVHRYICPDTLVYSNLFVSTDSSDPRRRWGEQFVWTYEECYVLETKCSLVSPDGCFETNDPIIIGYCDSWLWQGQEGCLITS